MIEKLQLKGGISELNFGYTAKTGVYTKSSSYITKLSVIQKINYGGSKNGKWK